MTIRRLFPARMRIARLSPLGLAAAALVLMLGALGGCEQRAGLIVEPPPVGGPLLVRRLTESQYRAGIADIFGSDIPIAARFERGLRYEGLIAVGTSEAGMSPFGLEQYDAAARSIARAVVNEEGRSQLIPCVPESDADFDEPCALQFIERYAPLLLRRMLTADELSGYVGLARQAHAQLGNFYDGLEYALVGMMVSPEFLLRIERAKPDPENLGLWRLDEFSKAVRLSYFLTNSTPDEELLQAADSGQLATHEGLAKQVERLMSSPRFTKSLRAFFEDMLEFELFDELAKDPIIYPAFNSDFVADAKEQTLRTIVDHLFDREGDYRELFTTRNTYLTRPLGIVYRLPVPTRNGWEKRQFPLASHRSGIHTHASFLALHSHPGRSSPTLRGMALREIFLCQEIPDPPPEVNFSVVQDPSTTNMPTARERLEVHRTRPSCAGCHKIMDPLGLSLENFDGLGSFRTHEYGAPIEASGSLDGFDYSTTEEFAEALRDHPETPRCLVEKIYRYAVGRDTVWDERAYMDFLIASFEASGFSVPELMRTIALSENFFAVSQLDESGLEIEYASLHAIEEDST